VTKYFVTGGAGFVGANCVRRLLKRPEAAVTVFDNLSSGRVENLPNSGHADRLQFVHGDVRDMPALMNAMRDHEVVYHFASNSDIARAAAEPSIDFTNGTILTQNVLEAMRETGSKRIIFPSGSGVYGEVPAVPLPEAYPHMIPISTYGASKLASEALISAYAFMFGMTGTVFRLANVVGPGATHGVAYDFVRRLRQDSSALKIYGDGTQSKPYVHVDDVLDAFDLIERQQQGGYQCFNVGPQDHITVREIADIVVAAMKLNVPYAFTGGDRGWKADVPVYRLDASRLRAEGWSPRRGSREAVNAAVESLIEEWPAAIVS